MTFPARFRNLHLLPSFALPALFLMGVTTSGCSQPATQSTSDLVAVAHIDPQAAKEAASHVMVVINKASAESMEIGAYYRVKRSIPKENVLFIDVSTTEEVDNGEFSANILDPIKKFIQASKSRIDYIVLTSGTPIRIKEGGYSVDSMLASMDLSFPAIHEPINQMKEDDFRRAANPYYHATDHFDSSKYHMFLVTRLIGYTIDDAKGLVDHALEAKPVKGPFLIDMAGNRNGGGYKEMQDYMKVAADKLKEKKFDVQLDEDKAYVTPDKPLMGYCTWGSNDAAFNLDVYRGIKFLPGSVCETFVSTSARTFHPTKGGQSLIADLIANGVTGVKGYVSEPYTFALAEPDVLFDRYTSGYNLAESFYAASKVLKWKDLVVGDPLCSPYAK